MATLMCESGSRSSTTCAAGRHCAACAYKIPIGGTLRSSHRGPAVPTHQSDTMRIIAILLIALGALALIYGGFSYTQDKTAVNVIRLDSPSISEIDAAASAGMKLDILLCPASSLRSNRWPKFQ